MSRIQVIASFVGICHMRVCAPSDASDEDILAVCNRDNPAGTINGWTTVTRSGEASEAGPVQCANDPTRTHFMVAC